MGLAIEAYCSATSAFPGETLRFHARCLGGGLVRVAIRRVPSGEVVHTFSAECGDHPVPPMAHMEGCRWPVLATVVLPDDWQSGVYRADLVSDSGETTQLYFVVKARVPSSPVLMSLAVTTYEAYNYWPAEEWPGRSLYRHGSPDRSRRVSLDRPNPFFPHGSPQWEESFLRWAEIEGLTVDCCTSIDLHLDPDFLSRYQLLLSMGHDEYWSKEMRDNVEAFVTRGGNVAFFSGNTCQWQIRFEDNERTIVCYKNPFEDPLTGVDNDRVTVEWYVPPVERPTNTLTGVSFRNGAGFGWGTAPTVSWDDAAYAARFPEHWVFDGVTLAEDGSFGRGERIVGYETDAADYVEVDGVPLATGRDGTPESFVILATADLTSWRGAGLGGYATMGLFRRHGTVFTAATTDWVNGLDQPRSAVPQITRNVIRRLAQRIPTESWDLIGLAPRLASITTFERVLFAAGTDGRLWRRIATAQNVRWRDVGDAGGVSALASTEWTSGRLVAVKNGVLSWRHVTTDDSDWHEFSDAPEHVLDMTSADSSLFAVADGGLWSRTSRLEAEPWQEIDRADDIVSLESWWNMLFALTADGGVLWRPAEPHNKAEWNPLGHAPDSARNIGVVNGYLAAATAIKTLWWRPLA